MAKIIQFPKKHVNTSSIRELFSAQEYRHFLYYIRKGEEWRKEQKNDTLYEGYPYKSPCDPSDPIREDMIWYVDEMKNFGVWVINDSKHDLFVNTEFVFGWSPFVRYSTLPPHEPLNLKSAQLRERLVWYVDNEGYGQYAVIKSDAKLWVPIPRPDQWIDHNK